MKIVSVVGARPNFMKIAPVARAIRGHNAAHGEGSSRIEHVVVHTGQHYDDRMSRSFFRELDIPEPDVNLGIGSGSHAEQVGRTMIEFEKVIRQLRPDWVVVVGDVNATCACSITAKKEHIRLAHIEAGLRSGDISMPEEVNRLVTDRLSDLLLTVDRISSENLRAEGVPPGRVRLVGNVMIDTLEHERAKAAQLDPADIVVRNRLVERENNGTLGDFGVVTLHRPSNVDDPKTLGSLVDFFTREAASALSLVWPIHPRTRSKLEQFGLWQKVVECSRIHLLHPVGYHDMLGLNMAARVCLTDSGGLQEECCVLGTPCLTLRWNTERPVTLREHGGVSVLTGNDVARVRGAFAAAIRRERRPVRPELWDGSAAERILTELQEPPPGKAASQQVREREHHR